MSSLLFKHGPIWTADPSRPRAEAVLTEGDRILRVGDEAELEKLATAETRIIDLDGALLIPGFIDCHTHFLKGGYALSRIQLRDVTSREAFAERIAAKVAELEKGSWILDGHWDHERFSPPGLPDRSWIDRVSPDHPVCVHRYDLHSALLNSLALRTSGITKDTVAPDGGEIEKDPRTGEPTGILRDAALDLVAPHIPKPSRKAALGRGRSRAPPCRPARGHVGPRHVRRREHRRIPGALRGRPAHGPHLRLPPHHRDGRVRPRERPGPGRQRHDPGGRDERLRRRRRGLAQRLFLRTLRRQPGYERLPVVARCSPRASWRNGS